MQILVIPVGSRELLIGVSAPAPLAPSGLTATAVSTSQINLAWTDNSSDEDSFVLERSPNGSTGWAQIATPAADATSHSDGALNEDTTYYYRVLATNENGDSAYSNTASATTQSSAPATYAYSLVDPGVSALLDSWHAAEVIRQGTASPLWWLWQVAINPWASTDHPGFVVAQHYNTGVKYFKNLVPTNGGTIAFEDVTLSELGANSWTLGDAPGEIVVFDADGDGVPEHACKKQGVGNGVWSPASGTLTALSGVSIDGQSNYLERMHDVDADGDVDLQEIRWPLPVSLTSFNDVLVRRYTWNGSSYTVTSTPYTFPTGVPAAVIDDCYTRLKTTTAEVGQLVQYTLDLDADGTDDLVIAGYFAYSSIHNFAYYLENNGDGTYTDRTTTWGLPRDGTFLSLQPAQLGVVRLFGQFDRHLHTSIDGTGVLHLFIGNHQTNSGMYRWNGSSFTKQTSALTASLGSLYNFNEPYTSQLYALDLTNSGRLDLVMTNPRQGRTYLFTNNGSGTFTRVDGPLGVDRYWATWDPYGFAVADLRNSGRLDIVLGGTSANGVGSGSLARKLAVLKNDTTNPKNYLKVKLRRAITNNPFGIGGNVEVFEAGTTTLLRRWPATPSGVPIHFGLGTRSTVDVKVNWPTGAATTQSGVAANQTVTITG